MAGPSGSAEAECWTESSRALLPAPLHDAFTAVPLYLDLTDEAAAARDDPNKRPNRLTLDNADFKVKVAAIQGRLRGMEPADIVSEDLDLWRRAERRRRWVWFGLVSLTLLSLVAGVRAILSAAESDRRETEARSGRLASQSDLDRVDLGMLLGVEAYRVDQSAESFGALITGAGKAADLEKLLHEHSRPVRSVAFDPDGEILASTGLDGTVVLRSTETWTPTGPPLVPGGASVDADDLAPLRGLDLDRFGRLAAASRSGTVHLWDISEPSAPEELPPIEIDRGSPVLAVAFDSAGSTLLAGGPRRGPTPPATATEESMSASCRSIPISGDRCVTTEQSAPSRSKSQMTARSPSVCRTARSHSGGSGTTPGTMSASARSRPTTAG